MKAAIFFAEGFEECEGLIIVDMIRRAGQEIDTVSVTDSNEVISSHNITVTTDKILKEVNPSDYDTLIIPGGLLGTENIENTPEVVNAIKNHFEEGKLTCAICAGPSVLGHAGVLKGKKYTCFPTCDGDYGGEYQWVLAVQDGNLITGRGMGAAIEFSRTILKNVINEEEMKKLEFGIQYEHTFLEFRK